jgi:hypothetical protein
MLEVVVMPIILALGRLRQEAHKFYTSLCYTARPGLKKKKKVDRILFSSVPI